MTDMRYFCCRGGEIRTHTGIAAQGIVQGIGFEPIVVPILP